MQGSLSAEKVQAVCDAPASSNVLKLKYFLGLLAIYSKFLSTCLLYSLPFADCYDTPLHGFGDNRKWMHSKLSRSYLSQH